MSCEAEESLLLTKEQLRIRQHEKEQLEKGWEEFSEEQVQQSIVHSRRDVALLMVTLAI